MDKGSRRDCRGETTGRPTAARARDRNLCCLAGIHLHRPQDWGTLKLVAVKGPTQASEARLPAQRRALHSLLFANDFTAFTPPAGRAFHNCKLQSRRARKLPASRRPSPRPTNSRCMTKIASPARDPHHPLPNRDLDTGQVVQPGGYSLTDSTYADLLHRLTRSPAQAVSRHQGRHPGLLRQTRRRPSRALGGRRPSWARVAGRPRYPRRHAHLH